MYLVSQKTRMWDIFNNDSKKCDCRLCTEERRLEVMKQKNATTTSTNSVCTLKLI